MGRIILEGIELNELLNSFRDVVRTEISTITIAAPPNTDKVKYYKRKEVAALLNISLVTLSDWQKKGLINFSRIKSRVYFTQENIDAAMSIINRNNSGRLGQ